MNKVERVWGHYTVLYENGTIKVKELVIKPGYSLSMQRHRWRSETWHVVDGICDVYSRTDGADQGYRIPPKTLFRNDQVTIQKQEWHQLCNPYNGNCVIIETQFGDLCEEEDIERQPDTGGIIEKKVVYV